MARAHAEGPPWEDPIVAEVRRARAALFASVGYDLEALAKRLRQEQATSRRRIVVRPPRRVTGEREGQES
jgi:hypothetical protein